MSSGGMARRCCRISGSSTLSFIEAGCTSGKPGALILHVHITVSTGEQLTRLMSTYNLMFAIVFFKLLNHHGGSGRRLKSATNFSPLLRSTFFPSSVSVLMTVTHSSNSCSVSDTRSKEGCASKCVTIQL